MLKRKAFNDWSDFEAYKITVGKDPMLFDVYEKWDIDYLNKKINASYPRISPPVVRTSILLCCIKFNQPQPRKEFTDLVLKLVDDLTKYP